MKDKMVHRYYCDYCKKSGGSKSHMMRHEKHCTMNPSRECRMCAFIENDQPDLLSLKSLLPDPAKYKEKYFENVCGQMMEFGETISQKYFEEIDRVFPTLRHKAGNCPSCILAALRQTGNFAGDLFDFKKEAEEIFKERRDWENEHQHYHDSVL